MLTKSSVTNFPQHNGEAQMLYLERDKCVGQASEGRKVSATKFTVIRFLIIPRAPVTAMLEAAPLFPKSHVWVRRAKITLSHLKRGRQINAARKQQVWCLWCGAPEGWITPWQHSQLLGHLHILPSSYQQVTPAASSPNYRAHTQPPTLPTQTILSPAVSLTLHLETLLCFYKYQQKSQLRASDFSILLFSCT